MTVSEFYKLIFGQKIYKISLDGGCTCPNRDGTLGTGGCIFCSAAGSGDFVPSKTLSISEQIEKAKTLVESKLSKKISGTEKKYIAYFQNFTNTYGDSKKLLKNWEEALSNPQIVGLAIGTRPDCLSDEILSILSDIANKTFLQVELGLQTTNEKSAFYIRRGFDNECYFDAVKKLKQANPNLNVINLGDKVSSTFVPQAAIFVNSQTRDDMNVIHFLKRVEENIKYMNEKPSEYIERSEEQHV